MAFDKDPLTDECGRDFGKSLEPACGRIFAKNFNVELWPVTDLHRLVVNLNEISDFARGLYRSLKSLRLCNGTERVPELADLCRSPFNSHRTVEIAQQRRVQLLSTAFDI